MQNIHTAEAYERLGSTYRALNNIPTALEYFQKELAAYTSLGDSLKSNVGDSYMHIGHSYEALGDLAQAEVAFLKALECYEACDDYNNTILIVDKYEDVGDFMLGIGKTNEGLKLYAKTLPIYEMEWSNVRYAIADQCQKVGKVYKESKEYVGALTFYHKAVGYLKHFYYEDSLLADSLVTAPEVEYTERSYTDEDGNLVEEMTMTDVSTHMSLAEYYQEIADLYAKTEDRAKALEYYLNALRLRKALYGDTDEQTGMLYSYVADFSLTQNDIIQARDCYLKAIEILESQPEADDLSIAMSYNGLALIYGYEQKNFAQAIAYSEKAKEHALQYDEDWLIEYVEKHLLTFKYERAVRTGDLQSFFQTHCTVAIFEDNNTPANAQGLSGEYALLEFADWNIGSPTSVFDKIRELQSKPLDLVVMDANGTITRHHFDDKIGVQFAIKEVGAERMQTVVTNYQAWKQGGQ